MTSRASYRRTRSSGEGTIIKLGESKYRSELRWTDASGARKRSTKVTQSLRDANKALTELKRLRDSVSAVKPEQLSVGDLLDRWLDFKSSQVSAGTLDQYQYAIRHIKGETDSEYANRIEVSVSANKRQPKRYQEGLANILVAELHSQEIDKFLKSKTDEGLSPRYVKLLRTVLSMSLDQGVKWRMIESNPATISTSIRQKQRHGRSLSEDKARDLLELAKTDRLGALWIVLLSLGLRRGEAIALTWQDYDPKAKTLNVTKARKKEGSKVVVGSLKTDSSKRLIPLPTFVCDVLENHRNSQQAEQKVLASHDVAWKQPTAMFTTAWGQWLDPDNTSKLFKTLAAKVGLADWHLHELRHSAATILLSNGVPLEQVSKLLGHSSIRITSDTYSHLLTEHLRSATDTMGDYLSGLID